MINFEDIIEKYNIICNDELFYDKILKHYDLKESDSSKKNLIIGEQEEYNKNDDILIIGNENINFKSKKKLYCLSEIDQEYYEDLLNINIEVILFNIKKNENPKNKISFFIDENEKSNKIFKKYIKENDNIFYDIKSIKIIILKKLDFIGNPYINIAITSGINYEIINFYYLYFLEIISNLKKNYNNLYHKYFSYRFYFFKLFKLLNLISDKTYINVDYPLLGFISKDNNENFITITDDKKYAYDTCKKNGNLIILINDSFIFKKLDKNLISLNSFFFDNKNKDITIKKATYYNFIITKIEDYEYFKLFIQLYEKYNINFKIRIYSDIKLPIQTKKISEFKIKDNSKIYYSSNYRFNFNELVLKNVEFKEISKLSVLISSTQYPGYGGAATNAYNIIKKFQEEDKFIVSGLFIHNDDDLKDKYNPENLPNIFCGKYYEMNPEYLYYEYIIKINTTPDIAFCKNCMAPKIIKNNFPNCIVIFLVSGIMGFRSLTMSANKIQEFNQFKKKQEIESIRNSNLIICNSNLTINYFNKIYTNLNNLFNKPVDTTKYNVSNIEPYKSIHRSIDIIIIVSNVERPVKNIKFFQEILNTNILSKYKIKVIGDNADELFKKYNVDVSPLISQSEVIKFLKDSKVIIIPSLFDSNSNTFREAIFCGALPFISINVAHPKKLPKLFIIDDYNPKEWANRIKFAVTNFEEISKKYSLTKYFKNNDNLLDFVF